MRIENNANAEQIQRITAMEAILQSSRQFVRQAEAALEDLEQAAPGLAALNNYYGSPLWWEDYDADEAGKLPADLGRGVLSEDEAYNLLEDYQQVLRRMADLARRVLPAEAPEGAPEIV